MSNQSVEEIKANLKSHQQIFSIIAAINSAIASNDSWYNTISDSNSFLEKSSSEIMEIFVNNFLLYFNSIFNEDLDKKDVVKSISSIKNNSKFSYSERRRARVFFEIIDDIAKAKKELDSNEDSPNDWS